MKVLNKHIEELIIEIAGKEALPIYRALKGKSNVNEFLIAEKLKLTINQIRNILYKFDNYNLVSSTRKKDRKKGWYIYFWTFDMNKAKKLIVDFKNKKLKELEKELQEINIKQFYICPNKCVRFISEEALEHQYMCPECGSLLELEDTRKKERKIKREINALKKELGIKD